MFLKLLVSSLILAAVGVPTVIVAGHSTHPAFVFLIGAGVAFVAILFTLLIFFSEPHAPQEF